jgi:hypothetical protein
MKLIRLIFWLSDGIWYLPLACLLLSGCATTHNGWTRYEDGAGAVWYQRPVTNALTGDVFWEYERPDNRDPASWPQGRISLEKKSE